MTTHTTDGGGEMEEGLVEMWLCEQNSVFLHPDKVYIFRVDKDCRRCVELAERADVRPDTEAESEGEG